MANATTSFVPTIFAEDWLKIWDEWNVQGFIILSFSLQTFLYFLAPLRKQTKKRWVLVPLWSAYLLADWAANFALGLIASSQGRSSETSNNNGLMVLWAPFLLIHLGGPDTITSFSLEDNELWLRHFYSLILQCLAIIYVLLQAFPSDGLRIMTLLMFLTGVIKYAERTRSLYLASFDNFRDSLLMDPDPGLDYAKLVQHYRSKKEAQLPVQVVMIAAPWPDRFFKYYIPRNLGPFELVQYAYKFFETFKGLIVNHVFSFREKNKIQYFFLGQTPGDAFRLIELELNFFYDALHTKLNLMHSKIGYMCSIFTLGSLITTLVLFRFFNKSNFHSFDVSITHTLLIGALIFDAISGFMFIFSNWTIIKFEARPKEEDNKDSNHCLPSLWLRGILIKWFNETRLTLLMGAVRGTWSRNMATFNLIYYCLHQRSKYRETLYSFLRILSFSNKVMYVKWEVFPIYLRDFIVDDLKMRSEIADDYETAKEMYNLRGEWVLRMENCSDLLSNYIVDVEYDSSLLIWHIATELCYNNDLEKMDIEERENKIPDMLEKKFLESSKLLSDYMIYLLLMEPTLMSSVGGIGLIRFQDTCAEAKRFFRKVHTEHERGVYFTLKNLFSGWKNRKEVDKDIQKRACKEILDVVTDVKPINLKGDRSKSVFFDGSSLAKELHKLEIEKGRKYKWEVVSKVWMELMCYAATRIQTTSHMQQVSKGGELISFVWLLMVHFGLGDNFMMDTDGTCVKVIISSRRRLETTHFAVRVHLLVMLGPLFRILQRSMNQ